MGDLPTSRLFFSCDWGTTAFRLRLVETETGKILAEKSSGDGIKKIFDQWKASDGDREVYFLSTLKRELSLLKQRYDGKTEGIPVLISGMASSAIGFRPMPYTSLPLDLYKLELQKAVISPDDQFPHPLVVISGLKTEEDVMRGEETQLLGLAGKYPLEDSLCILPGTHSKHLIVKKNVLADFKTYMTGELFELLTTQSILRNSVQKPVKADKEAFFEGVKKSKERNFLHSLFSIRCGDLLHDEDPQKSYDLLSGLVIGMELQALGSLKPAADLLLAGEGALQQYYSQALGFLNLEHQLIKQAHHLTVEGHRFLMKNTDRI